MGQPCTVRNLVVIPHLPKANKGVQPRGRLALKGGNDFDDRALCDVAFANERA